MSRKVRLLFRKTEQLLYDLYLQRNKQCACCGQYVRFHRQLMIDHDHATGWVRDLLCNSCNVSEGFAKTDSLRDPEMEFKIAAYLAVERSQQLWYPYASKCKDMVIKKLNDEEFGDID